jgi:hypothetical protein
MNMEFRRERIPKPEVAEVLPETIAAAAIKIKGELFQGGTHGDAWQIALIDHPEFDTEPDLQIDSGFLTSTNRYVTREEGMEIAKKAEQLRKEVGRRSKLDSNDIWHHNDEPEPIDD